MSVLAAAACVVLDAEVSLLSMSQISELLTLQELDDEAAKQHARLAEVERLLAGDEELDAARQRVASSEAAVAPVRKDQVKLDGQVKLLASKIEQEEKKLYSGTVTSPKELQNIQHEVDSLKEQHRRLSDQLIELELRLEELTNELDDATACVAALDRTRAAAVETWKREATALKGLITSVDTRRLGQQAKVPPQALAIYERVRLRRGGMAVARIQGSTCSACRVSMPDSVRKRVFSQNSVLQCPNCERILYLG